MLVERYGNWTTDKKWLVKHLVTEKVSIYSARKVLNGD